MSRDNILRLIALIGLSALVYYFSFEQGREDARNQIIRLQNTIAAKDRMIEKLALEVKKLKEELEEARSRKPVREIDRPDTTAESISVTIRLGSSRILFDARLVLTCLRINRERKEAVIQINLVQQGRMITERLRLGEALKFPWDGKKVTIILNQIHSSQVTVQIIQLKD